MRKKFKAAAVILSVAVMLFALTGCPKEPQNQARDGIAAAKGFIESEQGKHQAECAPELGGDPTRPVCVLINKEVAAQNFLIDVLEAYCGSPAFNAGTGPCEPHADLLSKLQSAMTNLQDISDQIKALKAETAPATFGTKTPMIAGLALSESAFLGLLDTVLGILGLLITGLTGNPLYAGLLASLQKAVEEIERVKDEVLTKAELESLRTKPLW